MSKYAMLFQRESGRSSAPHDAISTAEVGPSSSPSAPITETKSATTCGSVGGAGSNSGSGGGGASAAEWSATPPTHATSPSSSEASPSPPSTFRPRRLLRRHRGGADNSGEGAARDVRMCGEELGRQTSVMDGTEGGAEISAPGVHVAPSDAQSCRHNDASNDDDDSKDDGDDDGREVKSAKSATTTTVLLYSCDACSHFITSSYRDLERHALHHHGDTLTDYSRLRSVAEKLVPVWSAVVERKADTIRRLGKEVFRVAVQRDAGAAKMAEAHRARAQLELVTQRWHPGARVFIFGSSVAFGVWDGMSDIDFTVVDVNELEKGLWPPSEKNAVRTITELLRRAGFSYINLEPISHARVPIIKHHASLPIRLTDEQRHRLYAEAAALVNTDAPAVVSDVASPATTTTAAASESGVPQLEAELVIARSVRYTLNLPASPLDSAVLEASIRVAVGNAAVQQVWWNRSREMCCVTFDTTTNAVLAATCPLHFVSAGMRARVQPLHEECRPELYGMDFDLSFRAFGIRNSHLLRRYLLSHPCARPGALVLKDWSKSSGVNNSVNGYLTSYAINIMWIYYLVHHGIIPYVSPAADIPASLRGNVSGDPDYTAMVDPAWTAEERAAMEAQAGELLLGFFYYYAFDFDWERNVVSLNQPGVTTKASLGWDVEDSALLSALPGTQTNTTGVMEGGGAGGGQLFGLHPSSSSPTQQDGEYTSNNSTNMGGGDGALTSARRSRATTRYSFCIEDPYEENLNLGRHMGVTKTLRVQTELYRGLLSLLKDDVEHSVVFAGTSSSSSSSSAPRSRTETTRDATGGEAEGLTEPTELPLRVLFRLMAIATRELAAARAAHASTLPPTPPLASSADAFPGIPLLQLTAAFAAQAPAEWKVACGAWNVQQVLHRLGLKLHGASQRVLPRREVGVRRSTTSTATGTPPAGVVATNTPEPTAQVHVPAKAFSASDAAAAAAALSSTLEGGAPTKDRVAELNSRLLLPVAPRHLSADVLLAVTRGYACLTPAWVAWSKPWAALSAWWTDRQHQPSTSPQHSTVRDGREGSTAPHTPLPPRVSALPERPVGVLRPTGTRLRHTSIAQHRLWVQGGEGRSLPRMGSSPAALRRAWCALLRC